MLGAFAKFKTNHRRERRAEGIAKAKAVGVYKGRKAALDDDRTTSFTTGRGPGATEIARALGISHSSV